MVGLVLCKNLFVKNNKIKCNNRKQNWTCSTEDIVKLEKFRHVSWIKCDFFILGRRSTSAEVDIQIKISYKVYRTCQHVFIPLLCHRQHMYIVTEFVFFKFENLDDAIA